MTYQFTKKNRPVDNIVSSQYWVAMNDNEFSEENEENEEYELFVESMIFYCHCCRLCQSIPCAGVLTGGPCDGICTCRQHDMDDGDNVFF